MFLRKLRARKISLLSRKTVGEHQLGCFFQYLDDDDDNDDANNDDDDDGDDDIPFPVLSSSQRFNCCLK